MDGWKVGIQAIPFGKPYFQVRAVSFRKGKTFEVSPASAELRRFGLDKGADGQVVDARSLEFSKRQTSGFFFSTKKQGDIFSYCPTGRDHIILPYLCEYHVIS